MQVRCPYCQETMIVDGESALTDLRCPNCDSNVNLAGDETVSQRTVVNQSIGHFEFRESLGEGAFGSVYKAHDTELDRMVAVKVPRGENMDAKGAEAFLREARAAAQLSHPNIVSIFEVGRQDDTVYLVSEFVDGLTLADWLTAKKMSHRHAVKMCVTLARALHAAHEAKVIHRDLKPSNIMLDSNMNPRIMDFGMARRESGERTMTTEGQVMGTPAYMSPEQAKGEAHTADARSDVYSLGVVLYELLTGEKPFRGNIRMLIHQVINEEPERPRSLNDKIARDVETITLKAMAKEPERRYASAQEFASDLQRWLNREPILARPAGPIERLVRWCQRNTKVAALSAAVLLLLTCIATGSSIAALRIKTALGKAEESAEKERLANAEVTTLLGKTEAARIAAEELRAAADRARKAEGEQKQIAERELYRSLVNESRSLRLSGRQGWKTIAIKAIDQAAALAKDDEERSVLAGERATCLNTIDYDMVCELSVHKQRVHAIQFSRDSESLVSQSEDGAVVIWDIGAAKHKRVYPDKPPSTFLSTLQKDAGIVPAFALLGNDAERILCATWQRGLRVLGKGLSGIPTNTKELFVKSVSKHPMMGNFAVGWSDGSVRVYSSNNGAFQKQFSGGQTGSRLPTAMDEYGNVAFASSRNTVQLGSRTNTALRTLVSHQNKLTALEFSPDNSLLASASRDSKVRIWSMTENLELSPLIGHTGAVLDVAFDASSETIATASVDGSVRLWDARTGIQQMALFAENGRMQCVSFSPDGEYLACGRDRDVFLYRLRRDRIVQRFSPHEERINGVAFHPTSRLMISAAEDRKIRFWDLQANHQHANDLGWPIVSGNQTTEFISHPKRTCSVVRLSPTGKWLAVGQGIAPNMFSDDHRVRVWDTQKLSTEPILLSGCPGFPSEFAFSPDESFVASSSFGSDPTIAVWDLKSHKLLHAWQFDRSNSAVVLAFLDEHRFLSSSIKGKLLVMDVMSGEYEELGDSDFAYGELRATIVSPTFEFVVHGDDNGRLHWIDPATGRHLRTVQSHTNKACREIAFSPDGSMLVASFVDGSARLWDAQRNKPLLTLDYVTRPELGNSIRSAVGLCFTPDSRQLLFCREDRELQVWDLTRILDPEPWQRELFTRAWPTNELPPISMAGSDQQIANNVYRMLRAEQTTRAYRLFLSGLKTRPNSEAIQLRAAALGLALAREGQHDEAYKCLELACDFELSRIGRMTSGKSFEYAWDALSGFLTDNDRDTDLMARLDRVEGELAERLSADDAPHVFMALNKVILSRAKALLSANHESESLELIATQFEHATKRLDEDPGDTSNQLAMLDLHEIRTSWPFARLMPIKQQKKHGEMAFDFLMGNPPPLLTSDQAIVQSVFFRLIDDRSHHDTESAEQMLDRYESVGSEFQDSKNRSLVRHGKAIANATDKLRRSINARKFWNTLKDAPLEIEIDQIGNASLDLSSGESAVTILDFWATWCSPCFTMQTKLDEWQTRYGANKVRVVGLSKADGYRWSTEQQRVVRDSDVSANEYKETIKAVTEHHGMEHEQGLVTPDRLETLQVRAYPTIFILDDRGYLHSAHVGATERTYQNVEAALEQLLSEREE